MEWVRESLGDRGRAAWDRAEQATGADPRLIEMVARFARAIDEAEEVRAEWVAAGRPLLLTRPNGRLVAHPLVELLRQQERRAARFGDELGMSPAAATPRRRPGRPAGSVSAPDRRGLIDAI